MSALRGAANPAHRIELLPPPRLGAAAEAEEEASDDASESSASGAASRRMGARAAMARRDGAADASSPLGDPGERRSRKTYRRRRRNKDRAARDVAPGVVSLLTGGCLSAPAVASSPAALALRSWVGGSVAGLAAVAPAAVASPLFRLAAAAGGGTEPTAEQGGATAAAAPGAGSFGGGSRSQSGRIDHSGSSGSSGSGISGSSSDDDDEGAAGAYLNLQRRSWLAGRLPPAVLAGVLLACRLCDAASLAATCTLLRGLSAKSDLWKVQRFPATLRL